MYSFLFVLGFSYGHEGEISIESHM
jgi:hypothetical protein